MILTAAKTPAEYIACLDGWQRYYAEALRAVVLESVPELEERLKWGHLVYFVNGPILLIRAEPHRVLFGFWRGKRLLQIEPRLRGGGKYEMGTLELLADTPLERDTAVRLVAQAAQLNRTLGDPTATVLNRR